MNKTVKEQLKELEEEVGAIGSTKLPFKFDGMEVYVADFEKTPIISMPWFFLVDEEGAYLADDDDCVKLTKKYRKLF